MIEGHVGGMSRLFFLVGRENLSCQYSGFGTLMIGVTEYIPSSGFDLPADFSAEAKRFWRELATENDLEIGGAGAILLRITFHDSGFGDILTMVAMRLARQLAAAERGPRASRPRSAPDRWRFDDG